MRFLRVFSLVLLLLLAVGLVSAQEPATSGTITVYTALEDDQIESYLTSFREQYPNITVNIVRDSTGIITARLLAEKDNPQADVVWGLAASSLLVLNSEGMLQPYAPAGLDRVEPTFRDTEDPPAWVGIDVWESAFCVNTIELERLSLPMPESWDDLLDPAYANYLVMPNPASSGTGFLTVSAILQSFGAEDMADPEKPIAEYAGWEYLDALDDNIAVYTHSGSAPCKRAGAGEFPIGISFGYRAVTQAQNGEPIVGVWPSEGSGWDVESNALMLKDEINPAAYTFLDWAIGADAMNAYSTSYPITSVPTGNPIPEGYPADSLSNLIENDLVWAAANRDAILTEWTARYDAKSEPR